MLEAFAYLIFVVRELLILTAAGFILSGADDLLIDGAFLVRRLRRALTVRRRFAPMCAEAMGASPAGRFAILLPAWDEHAVIAATLSRMVATIDHPRFRIFVGVYPNDALTLAAARSVKDRRIEVVLTSRPGPTSKADCLNHLWDAMRAHEGRTGVRYKAIVLHDAEDIVHPLELNVFDHLIPRLAMVQLPVLPLPDPGSRWVSGHYLDEFAESHGKDLRVREALGAAVPSAGVACALERSILDRIAAGGAPFDPACFTEDYELGLRVRRLGGRSALVRVRDAAGGLVATREYFPATVPAAVRQKSRWLLGIALAGWDRLGWDGSLADRYMLWRDRKPLWTAPLAMLGYVAGLAALATEAARRSSPELAQLPPVAAPGSLAAGLLGITAALLLWRLIMRAAFTARAYGPGEGLRSIPRAVVGNLINLLATVRAVRRYAALMAGRGAGWEKTAHRLHAAGAA